MRMQLLLTGLLLLAIPTTGIAQEKKVKTKVKDDGTVKIKTEEKRIDMKRPPAWANARGYQSNAHVYFPDYYTFYDPSRGYVYWDGTTWTTSESVPVFMSTVDLNTARMETLNNARLSEHPELKYDTYIRQYPAQPVQITVPVPPMR